MLRSNLIRVLVLGISVGICLLVLSSDAAAQCALCRSSVPQALAKNLNIAVIVLLAPPVTIFSAIFYIAFKNRKG
jgi:hypothetical protein